ncbi:thioredoxin domain-containing protein [Kineobactrum salinum]|uniref:Redoxin domain-containing protein n=1 Tax=Kineobactrum salinum TaxID=2708301 RepID=A0A6C0TXL5_9GAMM|nr:redoxin domain-containing protein [Kineobactrum salinum]QIB64572.1 redoxin domain-containing protein [Kineobactrum salinum]
MDFLVLSNIVLWIGFVAMVLVNLALARQIGVLYERVAPAGALMLNQKLRVGAPAPSLSLSTVQGGVEEVGGLRDGRSQLLFFLSPDCPICNELTPALKSAARAESSWLDLILVSDGEEQDHAGYIARKELTDFPYAVSELAGKTYGVSKLPYAILIDERGSIASLGIINSREHLDSLFEAKEHKVASIQEYMSKREAVQHYDTAVADKAEADKA